MTDEDDKTLENKTSGELPKSPVMDFDSFFNNANLEDAMALYRSEFPDVKFFEIVFKANPAQKKAIAESLKEFTITLPQDIAVAELTRNGLLVGVRYLSVEV